MKQLAGCLDRGLESVAADLPEIQGHVEVLRSIAATLDPAQGDCASRQGRFTVLREQLQASADSLRQQMGKVLASFLPGLFAGGDAADLPQDNLDLERWFRNPKGHERRIHGHRHAGVRIVPEGATMLWALDAHRHHPQPFTEEELRPYRHAPLLESQKEAIRRRKVMQTARSTTKRGNLLRNLEKRYAASPQQSSG